MSSINTNEYWEERFKGDWEKSMGREQTIFFYNLAIENFPEWFTKEINEKQLNICDLGCAEGDGVKSFTDFFKNSQVIGIDFSKEAIERANKYYPNNRFVCKNILDINESYDILFSSNTLEHITNPFEILDRLTMNADKYISILIPFEEYKRIDEHVYTFEYSNIPMKINDFYLVNYKEIDCREISNTHWFGKEILLIYANSKNVEIEKFRLDNLSQDIKQLLQDKINLQKESINKIKEQLDEKQEHINKLRFQLDEKQKHIKNLNNYINDKECYIAQLQVELNRYTSKIKGIRYIYKSYKVLRESGLKVLLKKVKNKIKHKIQIDKSRNTEGTCDNKHIFSKEGKKIYIFAGVPYYDIGGGQRSAQLAKTFNKMGYSVIYIYAYECSESDKKDIFIQAEKHISVKNLTPEYVRKNCTDESIFIFEIPHKDYEVYLELAKDLNSKIIYEHIDNWETTLGSTFFNKESFKKFLEIPNVVVCTSKLLLDKLEEFIKTHNFEKSLFNKVVYLANAVDSDLFDSDIKYRMPMDLIVGRKTLIYYGTLWGEWFDWELLINTAKICVDCSFNIIGDYEAISEKIKNMPSNIYFLGSKAQSELPAYLAYSDIALLPFKNDEIGKYVSPLKIFEYISMNKVVLTTKLPDIKSYPNTFAVDTWQEWIEVINSMDESLENKDEFILENNWYARCNSLLNHINVDIQKSNKKISIIILNYNNKNVIIRCIDSLIKYSEKYTSEIIVVDNGSTDGSYELIKERYKDKIILLKNKINGCASGRNLGVENAKGEILVFLDSDQWVTSERWLDSALEIMNSNEKIGTVGWAAGWFDKGSIAGIITDDLFNRGIFPKAYYRTDIGYLGSGGMVIEKKLFDSIEGFDENYDPTCYEDTDISLKIRNAGFELAYCPYINLKHLPHQTTKSGSDEHRNLMNKNGKYFLDKWSNKNSKLLEYYYE